MFGKRNYLSPWNDIFPLDYAYPAGSTRKSRGGISTPHPSSQPLRHPRMSGQLSEQESAKSECSHGAVPIRRNVQARWSEAPTEIGNQNEFKQLQETGTNTNNTNTNVDPSQLDQKHTELDVSSGNQRTEDPRSENDKTTDIEHKDSSESLQRLRDQLQTQLVEAQAAETRRSREFEQEKKRTRGQLAASFLPVLDNLNRCVRSGQNSQDQALLQGVEMVRQQFLQALASHGLEPFDSIGKTFDPKIHEAISIVAVPDASDHHKVVQEYEQGCYHDGTLLRAARVVVGKHESM